MFDCKPEIKPKRVLLLCLIVFELRSNISDRAVLFLMSKVKNLINCFVVSVDQYQLVVLIVYVIWTVY